jgi:hypothetical protein
MYLSTFIYCLLTAAVVKHFSCLEQVGYGQQVGSQFFGSQLLMSQDLSFLHSILAFFLAFFLPPPFAASTGEAIKVTASIATSNFFILNV